MFQLIDDEDNDVLSRVKDLVATRCFNKEEEREKYRSDVDASADMTLPDKGKKYFELLLEKIEMILDPKVCSDEEIDSFVHGVSALLRRPNISSLRVAEVIKKVADPKAENPTPPILRRRLRCLVILVNVMTDSESKFLALNTLLEYSRDHNAHSLIVHFHSKIDDWIKAWQLSISEKRKIYQNMSTILAQSDQTSLALNFLIKYFKTFEGLEKTAEVRSMAIEAVVSAVKSPVSAFSDRNALLVSFSGGTSFVEVALLNLLKIMCSGSVKDFSDFSKSADGSRVLTQYSINQEETIHKLRMMSFCAMGCEQNTITYTDIAAKLGLSSVDEVQDWVVEAVSQGLMEAYMDELNKAPNGELLPVVIITQCAHRSFSRDQWAILQGKLRHLRSTMSSVLDAINKK